MDIYRLKDLSAGERQTVLQGESVSKEEMAYTRPLTEDELNIQKDEMVAASILKAVIEDEFKIIKDDFKSRMEPLREKISTSLVAIKTKTFDMKGDVYKIPDFDNQMMHFVDDHGHVVSSRRMLPEERQYRLSGGLNVAM